MRIFADTKVIPPGAAGAASVRPLPGHFSLRSRAGDAGFSGVAFAVGVAVGAALVLGAVFVAVLLHGSLELSGDAGAALGTEFREHLERLVRQAKV